MDNQVCANCQLLDKNNKRLKQQIQEFDSFVRKDKELLLVFKTYLLRFPEYLIPATEIPAHLDLNNPYDLLLKLSLEKNNLEHLINERKRFVKMHKEVRQSFEKAWQRQNESKNPEHVIINSLWLTNEKFED